MKIKSRYMLRRDAERKIISELEEALGPIEYLKGRRLEMVETEDQRFIFVDGEPLLSIFEGRPFLTVRGALEINPQRKKVIVDKGAVPYVSKGADAMSPGIKEADQEIKQGDLVIVVEETHGKALAIGKALVPGTQMRGEKGKAVKTIHHVGDKLWNLS